MDEALNLEQVVDGRNLAKPLPEMEEQQLASLLELLRRHGPHSAQ